MVAGVRTRVGKAVSAVERRCVVGAEEGRSVLDHGFVVHDRTPVVARHLTGIGESVTAVERVGVLPAEDTGAVGDDRLELPDRRLVVAGLAKCVRVGVTAGEGRRIVEAEQADPIGDQATAQQHRLLGIAVRALYVGEGVPAVEGRSGIGSPQLGEAVDDGLHQRDGKHLLIALDQLPCRPLVELNGALARSPAGRPVGGQCLDVREDLLPACLYRPLGARAVGYGPQEGRLRPVTARLQQGAVGFVRRAGQERAAQCGLDEPVHGDVLIGERDQVVSGEQAQSSVDRRRSDGRRLRLLRHRESGTRYGLGRVPGKSVEQPCGQGCAPLQGPERRTPDAGDGPVGVVTGAGGVQHRRGRLCEKGSVRGEGHAGLPEIGTCLRECQRQVAELRGQGLGLPDLVPGRLPSGHGQTAQQAHRRPRGQHVDAQRLCTGAPTVRAAAGDELVSVAVESSEVGVEVRGALGVVEDEEPAVVGLEPEDRPLGLLVR